MSPLKPVRDAAVLMTLSSVLAATAFAGDRSHRRPEVDIESLRGQLWRAGGEWLLEVRYDVETEDYLPLPGELELILGISERGRALVERSGRVIEFIVPLEHPSEVDDDEMEFEDRVTVVLPDGAFHDPDRLRLEGIVVRAGDGYPLDRKDKSIDFDRPKPPKRLGLGVNIGVGRGVSVGVSLGLGLTRHHPIRTHHYRVRRAYHPVSIGRRHVGVGHHRVAADRERVRIGHHRTDVRRHIRHADRHRGEPHRRAGSGVRGRP